MTDYENGYKDGVIEVCNTCIHILNDKFKENQEKYQGNSQAYNYGILQAIDILNDYRENFYK